MKVNKMRWKTVYNYVIEPGEKVEGESMTDTSCYQSTSAIINRLMRVGQLPVVSSDQYDIPDDVADPHAYSDPTREPNFDFADLTALKEEIAYLNRRIKGYDKHEKAVEGSQKRSNKSGKETPSEEKKVAEKPSEA